MASEKRLIDANGLVPYLWDLFKFFGSTPCSEADKATQRGIKRCIGEIKKMPTVDAVVLPCKLGATVFVIGGKYRHGRFEKWINTGKFRLSDLDSLGKSVFLTELEAKNALAEMEG